MGKKNLKPTSELDLKNRFLQVLPLWVNIKCSVCRSCAHVILGILTLTAGVCDCITFTLLDRLGKTGTKASIFMC